MAALNRTMEPAEIYTLSDETDEYGARNNYELTGECDIFITLYSQNNTQDARYKDVTHVGIANTPLADSMQIVQNGRTYKVLLANNSARRNIAFLREVV